MFNSFLSAMSKESVKNSYTENGALTCSTSNNANLDFFTLASAKRGIDEQAIELFEKALMEDENLALKNLFYLRDIRGGQGERDIFRHCMIYLLQSKRWSNKLSERILSLIPEYGRWDDLIYMSFVGNEKTSEKILNIIKNQIEQDVCNMQEGKPISLLAKWFPIENNTKNKNKKRFAKQLRNALMFNNDASGLRKLMSNLRRYIDVVEQKMSSKEFNQIKYENVPSRAAILYRNAFKRNDEERYEEYLDSLKKGETKINTSVTYPYEIIREYSKKQGFYDSEIDDTLELAWKNLPDYTGNNSKAICVVDVSGSMLSGISNVRPIDVSLSLGMYFAERNEGPFKNYFITFSATPQLIEIKGNNIPDKLNLMEKSDWGMNTDIQAVFNLILNTAKKYKVNSNDMPETIYIISDMEFDYCARGYTNFEEIKTKYHREGYKMPNLVFWNVNSRNTNVPVTQNEHGVIMVSGCSPSIFENVISGKTPYEFMLEILNKPKYSQISFE